MSDRLTDRQWLKLALIAVLGGLALGGKLVMLIEAMHK